MQLGMVGLGRMGGNMAKRLRDAGHEVVGFDHNPDVSDVPNLADLVERLAAPRAIWVMVPAEVTEATIDELASLVSSGDILIDGGNSKFTEDGPRAERLAKSGIGYVDVGVSGGIWGYANGYGLMVGGSDENVGRLMPIFDALKPAGEFGFVHAGEVGAGHYAKMVHNGIEYGLMHAYAEGYELLRASEHVTNVPGVIKSWRAGIGGQDPAQRVEGSVEEQPLDALMVMKVLDMPQVLGSRADVRVQVRGAMGGNLQAVPGGQGGAAQEPGDPAAARRVELQAVDRAGVDQTGRVSQ